MVHKKKYDKALKAFYGNGLQLANYWYRNIASLNYCSYLILKSFEARFDSRFDALCKFCYYLSLLCVNLAIWIYRILITYAGVCEFLRLAKIAPAWLGYVQITTVFWGSLEIYFFPVHTNIFIFKANSNIRPILFLYTVIGPIRYFPVPTSAFGIFKKTDV